MCVNLLLSYASSFCVTYLRATLPFDPVYFFITLSFSFRYLTPTPIAPPEIQVNSVARQAGANPITLPTSSKPANNLAGGEISPTGVTDLEAVAEVAQTKPL